MATVKATVRRAGQSTLGKGEASALIVHGARTIELAPSASATVIDFGIRVPTNARVDASSRIYFDDLSTSGSPVLDVGLYAVDANTSTVEDALYEALAISSISDDLGLRLPKDYADAGKMMWELMSLSSDPGGFLDVKGVVRDAATLGNTGTITLDLKTYVD